MPIYRIKIKDNHTFGKIKAGSIFTVASTSSPQPSASEIAEALFLQGYKDSGSLKAGSPGNWEIEEVSKKGGDEAKEQRKQFEEAYKNANITERLPYVRAPHISQPTDKKEQQEPDNQSSPKVEKKSKLFGFTMGVIGMLGEEGAKQRKKEESQKIEKQDNDTKKGRGLFGFGSKKEVRSEPEVKKEDGLFSLGNNKKEKVIENKKGGGIADIVKKPSSNSTVSQKNKGGMFGKIAKSALSSGKKRR